METSKILSSLALALAITTQTRAESIALKKVSYFLASPFLCVHFLFEPNSSISQDKTPEQVRETCMMGATSITLTSSIAFLKELNEVAPYAAHYELTGETTPTLISVNEKIAKQIEGQDYYLGFNEINELIIKLTSN